LNEFNAIAEPFLDKLAEKHKIDKRQVVAMWFIGKLSKDYKLEIVLHD